MTTTPRFIGLSIVVSDMGRTLTFYRALGLDIPADQDHEPHVGIVLDGGFHLMFDTVAVVESFDAGWTPPSGGHRSALALECTDPSSVDALYASVTGSGHAGHLAPFDAFWGQRYTVVLDPDGNPVDLCASLS